MSTLEYLDEEGTVNFRFVPWKLLNDWLSELNSNPHVQGCLRNGVNRGKVIEELQNRKYRDSGVVDLVLSRGYGKDWLDYENDQGYTHFEELLIYQPKEWRKQAREYFFRYECNLDRSSSSEPLRTVSVKVELEESSQEVSIFLRKPSLVVLLHPELVNSRRHEPLSFLLAYDVTDPVPSLGLSESLNAALLRELSPLDYYFSFQENVQSYDLESLRNISQMTKHARLTLIKELDFMNVIGQRMAKHMIRQEVVNHLWKRSDRDGLCTQRQPLSMIFSGPSGNGKTELAKELAQLMNPPDKEAFHKVDCGKLWDASEVFGMSGAYQGAYEGSSLNNFVLRMANEPDMLGIILLDEIEKADREVIHGLYQVLDKGEWTNKKLERGQAQTVTIPCDNLIFIMTSNAADKAVIDFAKESSVHSLVAQDLEDASQVVEMRIRSRLQHAWPFTEAFIGRVGRIVPFFPMANKDLAEDLIEGEMMVVAKLCIEREQERLSAEGAFNVVQYISTKEKHKMALVAVEESIPEAGVRSVQKWVEANMGKKMRHALLLKKGGIKPGAQVRYFTNTFEKKVSYCEETSGKRITSDTSDSKEGDESLYA